MTQDHQPPPAPPPTQDREKLNEHARIAGAGLEKLHPWEIAGVKAAIGVVTPPAHPATGAMEALDRLLNDALCYRDGYGNSHVDAKTIRTALTAPITQPSAGDVEKVREVADMLRAAVGGHDRPYRSHINVYAAINILDTLFPKVGA